MQTNLGRGLSPSIVVLLFLLLGLLLQCACRISTNFSLKMDVGAGAINMNMQRHFQWGDEVDANLAAHRSFTLQEAQLGVDFSLQILRTVVRKDCEVSVCPKCNGTGIHKIHTAGYKQSHAKHSHEHTSQRGGREGGGGGGESCIHSQVSLPCPHCLGAGLGSRICNGIYRQVEERVHIHMDAFEVRPGYMHIVKGKGHELYRNTEAVYGDLLVTVDAVSTGNFTVNAQGDVVVNVELSAWQALYGFTMTTAVPLIDKSRAQKDVPDAKTNTNTTKMSIDRRGKTTLPGSKIEVGGRGLPPIGSLVVSFALETDPASVTPVESPAYAPKTGTEGGISCSGELKGITCSVADPADVEADMLKQNETMNAEKLQRVKLERDAAARRILHLLQARIDRDRLDKELNDED